MSDLPFFSKEIKAGILCKISQSLQLILKCLLISWAKLNVPCLVVCTLWPRRCEACSCPQEIINAYDTGWEVTAPVGSRVPSTCSRGRRWGLEEEAQKVGFRGGSVRASGWGSTGCSWWTAMVQCAPASGCGNVPRKGSSWAPPPTENLPENCTNCAR